MPEDNPTDILLAHDRWATRAVLDACGALSDAQLDRPFEMGPGSLRATLTHVLGAMRGWTDFLNQSEPRPRPEQGGSHSVAQLTELHNATADELQAAIRAGDLADAITGERRGRTYTFTRAAVLCHITTHGMHHRAQCLNMLRHLGADPLPPSSVMEWCMTRNPTA